MGSFAKKTDVFIIQVLAMFGPFRYAMGVMCSVSLTNESFCLPDMREEDESEANRCRERDKSHAQNRLKLLTHDDALMRHQIPERCSLSTSFPTQGYCLSCHFSYHTTAK